MPRKSEIKAIRPGLVRVVEAHFPVTAIEPESNHPWEGLNALAVFSGAKQYSKPSHFISERITEVLREPEGYFGLVTNQELERLDRLRKAAIEYERAIDSLTSEDQKRIHHSIHDDHRHIGDHLVTILSEYRFPVALAARRAMVISESAKKVLNERRELPQADGRRHWQIAALAGICREIWAEQEWAVHPEKYGSQPAINVLSPNYYRDIDSGLSDRYKRFIEDFAPRTAKKDAPGPFGRFLTDVLDIVHTESNDPPSAQSALRSWQDARKQLGLI
ncbi:hypothetical protein [Marivita sp.]|uniref:hypothetical protein n=1 Tax=Marivita sp. TaxID=2003365 RepID=UPI003F71F232